MLFSTHTGTCMLCSCESSTEVDTVWAMSADAYPYQLTLAESQSEYSMGRRRLQGSIFSFFNSALKYSYVFVSLYVSYLPFIASLGAWKAIIVSYLLSPLRYRSLSRMLSIQ